MSGTLGPRLFIPDPSNTQSTPGQGWSAGISAIGNALFPNPSLIAEARLRGAQTQQVQQQIQQTAAATGARQHLSQIFAGPGALADPNTRSQASSLISMLPPDEQAQARQNVAIQMANSGIPQQQIDQWNASAGLTNYTQTPTGVNAELQNRINVAGIGAGATLGAARIQSGAMLQAERERTAESAREYNLTPTGTVSDGTVVNVPRGPVSGAMPAWAGQPAAVATDIARSAAAIGSTPMSPAATPMAPSNPPSHGISPGAIATQPGVGSSGGGVLALPANAQGNPSPGPGTPGPGMAGTPGTPGTPGTIGTAQDALANRMTLLSGLPPNRLTPTEALQMKVLLNQKAQDLGTSIPGGQGEFYQFGPNVQNLLTARVNQLMQSTDRRFANNPQAAIDQAYSEIVEPIEGNANYYNARRFSGLPPMFDIPSPGGPAAPTPPAPAPATPLAPSANAPSTASIGPLSTPMAPTGRQGIGPPASLHPSAQPGGGNRFQTTPGGSIAQSTPIVPGVPLPGAHHGETQTPMAPVGPAPMPPSQLVPHRTKVNGYTYTGGNPRSPTSWMKAPGG